MKEILRIAKKHNLKVIEDASEAHGAVFNSKADITCFSLFKNKIIHAEEGGICTTNSKKYADKMNYYKNMTLGKKHDYFHEHVGYNYRMPEGQATLALKSLKNVDKELKRRRKMEEHYKKTIKDFGKRDVVWVYDYIGKPIKGLDTRPFFKPLSSFPMYGGKCTSPRALHYSKIGNIIKI